MTFLLKAKGRKKEGQIERPIRRTGERKREKRKKENHQGKFQHFQFKVCAIKHTCVIWRDLSVAEMQQTFQVAEVFDVARYGKTLTQLPFMSTGVTPGKLRELNWLRVQFLVKIFKKKKKNLVEHSNNYTLKKYF